MEIQNRSIADFYGKEYLDYARYVVEGRALPSLVDGLKPGARKIIHAALASGLTTKKKQKMTNLVGDTYRHSEYHHGPVSLENTMNTLSDVTTDTLAPLRAYGAAGTLRDPGFAAARYLSVSLSEHAKLLKQDIEILEYNYDGSDRIEPKHYLPIIPTILTKRTSGIALGYAYSSTCSYNPSDIIDACIEVLKSKKNKLKSVLRPHVLEYTGNWEFNSDKSRIRTVGKYSIRKDKITINEFGVNETFSSFERNLNHLQDTGEIQKWENNSKDDNVEYVVKAKTAKITDWEKRGRIVTKFKIQETLKKPNYTVLDEFGKVKKFRTPESLLEYFVSYRLTKYDKLKALKLANLNERIEKASDIQKFIDLYLQGIVKLNNKTSIEVVKKVLDKYKLPHSVLNIPVYKLTKEEYDKLQKEIDNLKKEFAYLQKTTPEKLYMNDLTDLQKDFKDKYPGQDLLN